jgi:hypothetical protein
LNILGVVLKSSGCSSLVDEMDTFFNPSSSFNIPSHYSHPLPLIFPALSYSSPLPLTLSLSPSSHSLSLKGALEVILSLCVNFIGPKGENIAISPNAIERMQDHVRTYSEPFHLCNLSKLLPSSPLMCHSSPAFSFCNLPLPLSGC